MSKEIPRAVVPELATAVMFVLGPAVHRPAGSLGAFPIGVGSLEAAGIDHRTYWRVSSDEPNTTGGTYGQVVIVYRLLDINERILQNAWPGAALVVPAWVLYRGGDVAVPCSKVDGDMLRKKLRGCPSGIGGGGGRPGGGTRDFVAGSSSGAPSSAGVGSSASPPLPSHTAAGGPDSIAGSSRDTRGVKISSELDCVVGVRRFHPPPTPFYPGAPSRRVNLAPSAGQIRIPRGMNVPAAAQSPPIDTATVYPREQNSRKKGGGMERGKEG